MPKLARIIFGHQMHSIMRTFLKIAFKHFFAISSSKEGNIPLEHPDEKFARAI
jgi:hypothetical protein